MPVNPFGPVANVIQDGVMVIMPVRVIEWPDCHTPAGPCMRQCMSPRILVNRVHKISKLERLGKDHVKTCADCPRLVLFTRITGDCDQRDKAQRFIGTHTPRKVEAIHVARQSEIAEDDVWLDLFCNGQGHIGAVCDMGNTALDAKNVADKLGKVLIVFDNQCSKLVVLILHREEG